MLNQQDLNRLGKLARREANHIMAKTKNRAMPRQREQELVAEADELFRLATKCDMGGGLLQRRVFRDLAVGQRFISPRKEEGVVEVMCPPGRCTHDQSRDDYSCHVRMVGGDSQGNQFFVNQIPTEEVELVN